MLDEQLENIRAMEAEMSLPPGFFEGLMHDDDWSFVIKVHALVEAAVTNLLIEKFNAPALRSVFSFLELSNKRTGKIAFVSQLDLLPKEQRRYISTLSEVRNDLAHKVQNVNIDLRTYIAQLPSKTRKNFYESFAMGLPAELREDVMQGRYAEVSQYPKLAIWIGALVLLSGIVLRKQIVLLDRQLEALDVALKQNGETEAR